MIPFISLFLWIANLLVVGIYGLHLIRDYGRARNPIAIRFLFLLGLYAYSIFVNLFLIVPVHLDSSLLSTLSVWGDISGYSVLIGLLFHFDRRSQNRKLAFLAKLTYTLISITLGFLLLSSISGSTLIVGSEVMEDGRVFLVRSNLFSLFSFLSASMFIVTYYVFLAETALPLANGLGRYHPKQILVLLFSLLILSQGIFARLGSIDLFLIAELINTGVLILVTCPQTKYPEILHFKKFNVGVLLREGQVGWAIYTIRQMLPVPIAYSLQFLKFHDLKEDFLFGSAGTMMLMFEHAETAPLMIFPMPSNPRFTIISLHAPLCQVPQPQQVLFTLMVPSSFIPPIEDLKRIKGGVFSHLSCMNELEQKISSGEIHDIFVSILKRVYAS